VFCQVGFWQVRRVWKVVCWWIGFVKVWFGNVGFGRLGLERLGLERVDLEGWVLERLGLAGWVWAALLSRRWRRRRTRTERTGSWRGPARRPVQSWMRRRRTRPAPPVPQRRRRASGPGTTGSAAAAPPREGIKWGINRSRTGTYRSDQKTWN
jgi:hypothetical protein